MGTIRQELLKNPRIVGVSFGQYLPFNVGSKNGYDTWEGNESGEEIDLYRTVIDPYFLDVMQISLLAGRMLKEEEATDETRFLLNETAVRQLGWTPDEAVGKRFGCDTCEVIGVVEDYHFLPLNEPMAPLLLYGSTYNRRYAFVRVQPTEMPETLASIEETMKQFAPNEPFEYTFMDEQYAAMYSAEQRFGKTVGIFTILAIFIACLGLFGLASFTAQRRTKEVGIRKVLGASASDIVVLLSREFAVLVLIAFAIAAPVGYFVMNRWLQDFAYRMTLGPGTFLVAGIGVLLLALLTVSYQAHRAARSNPVQTLRYE
jgi:putative ABC transport system permease protein